MKRTIQLSTDTITHIENYYIFLAHLVKHIDCRFNIPIVWQFPCLRPTI